MSILPKASYSIFPLLCLTVLVSACSPTAEEVVYPYNEGDDIPALAYLEHDEVYNPESVIPPQCYTKTEGVNNPCYACHQSYDKSEQRPNQMGDGTLQGNYEFSDVGLTNSWKNLFIDRREMIKEIPNHLIDDWVDEDNYKSALLASHSHSTSALQKNEKTGLPAAQGIPQNMQLANLAEPSLAFAKNGLAKDDSFWVAYNYKPFPSTFWPTNGSFGDAMIRLPQSFRQINGKDNEDIYFLNLAVLEMTMKGLNRLAIFPFDEQQHNLDINGDGELSASVNHLEKPSHYFGDAEHIELAYMLYPEGTEFLHTVRYLGEDKNGDVIPSKRMKEVRYMQKHVFRNRQSLASAYYAEAKDKHFEQLPQTRYLGGRGIDNGFGWTINAYIEDAQGELRPQHKQELAFCNGCHKSVGATFDQTFSFARKAPGARGWGYINLKSLNDAPNIGEELGEYLTYMSRVGGGDEFRQNTEMLSNWFDDNGKLDSQKVARVSNLQELIVPSSERARDLNKAYLTIVKEQSYLFGRDATITKATNVLETIDAEQPPLLNSHQFQWDMRLDWQEQESLNLVKED
ncbi:hypothetical protein [Alteromonas sp. BMJM2]|uniref:hypothetical protein n=1 Tax=Alteromonas sp. BMJM2 TaxID=2954241 RepID=UPI0022B53F52|nr:hypothetical protein [Alteromonas sp. BMJM2]